MGPCFTSSFTISHRKGLPSAAKNRGAVEVAGVWRAVGTVTEDAGGVGGEPGSFMRRIQNVSRDQNKLNHDLIWRMIDEKHVNVDPIWRKIEIQVVNICLQMVNVGEMRRILDLLSLTIDHLNLIFGAIRRTKGPQIALIGILQRIKEAIQSPPTLFWQ